MNRNATNQFIDFVRTEFSDEESILLHRPLFGGNEQKYVAECIESNFVSSVGAKVTEMEQAVCEATGAGFAVATVNGTAALHTALVLTGTGQDCEVITQALTFVATGNAINYCGAEPVFVDTSVATLGMCPTALNLWLDNNARLQGDACYNKTSGRRISACVPMHTFGHMCEIARIAEVCDQWKIPLVEDSAESLGSFYNGKHSGRFGAIGALSFNGNKIITTGGGGMLVTDDAEMAALAKHLTTTAKIPHPYEYSHDMIGFNYRMPNLNAAMGCAQLEQLPYFLSNKRELAAKYSAFFQNEAWEFISEPANSTSNYWLNAIKLESSAERDAFLEQTNNAGVMTRPIWKLLNSLPMFQHCQHDGLENSRLLEQRIVNIPSSAR